jgi:hypothetical protein
MKLFSTEVEISRVTSTYYFTAIYIFIKLKSKAIHVTGCGGPQDCETSRFTDGGDVISLKSRGPFAPRMIRGTHFC